MKMKLNPGKNLNDNGNKSEYKSKIKMKIIRRKMGNEVEGKSKLK